MATTALKLSPTVSRSELMPDGTDKAFRALVHNFLSFSERLVAIRNGFASILGVSGAQYTILTSIAYLQADGGACLMSVCAHLRLDPSFVLLEARKLVNAGLLEWSGAGDTHAQVSQHGVALLNDLVRIQAPINDTLFRTVAASEFERLLQVMAELVNNAEAARAQYCAIEGRPTLLPNLHGDLATAKIDPKAFRKALGQFATGVTVVTTEVASGKLVGMTMNSFNSVSLDPPLILFSVAKTALSLRDLELASHYAINVLRADQHESSGRFARPLSDKWGGVPVKRGNTGCLMLEEALATFECVPYATYDGGDHVIFVGRVINLEIDECAEPLLYFRGQYASVARLPSFETRHAAAENKLEEGRK